MNNFIRMIVVLPVAIVIVACGGGGDKLDIPVVAQEEVSHNYTSSAQPTANYHPYVTPSHVYYLGDKIYIGGDVEPRQTLRQIYDNDGIKFYMGHSRDGIGVDRLNRYVYDLQTRNNTVHESLSGDYLAPFKVQPTVWYDPRILDNEATLLLIYNTLAILNDVLPPEFQLRDGGTLDERPYQQEGDIFIELVPRWQVDARCGATAVACASGRVRHYPNTHMYHSKIIIPDDLAASTYTFSYETVLHEFLHALGIWGHVDSIEFPDSILGNSGSFFPNLGFTIHRIDRETLQVMYMSQLTENYNDWGEWSDTSLHVVARAEDDSVHFGTAWFNGLPQPWARGVRPEVSLADNPRLFGRVSWDGAFVGFSGQSPLAGDVQLEVNLNLLSLPQDLRFRDIYYFNRIEDLNPSRWFPTRNLNYKVDMRPNGFYYIGLDGQIVGSFFGLQHESMGGTLKRTDMVGAFGGKR